MSQSVRRHLVAGIVNDSVINAVRLLGVRERYSLLPGSACNGSFTSMGIEQLGGLAAEGVLEYADDHYHVLSKLLHFRTIENISLMGLGEKLNRTDIIRASAKLARPSVSPSLFISCTTNKVSSLSVNGLELCLKKISPLEDRPYLSRAYSTSIAF